MDIRETLLSDIKEAPSSLLKPLYEIWKVLKMHSEPLPKGSIHPAASLIGSQDKEDAEEMEAIINKEFNTIEGEW